MALDRTCAVGTITFHMFAELPPNTGVCTISPEMMADNLSVFISDSLIDNVAVAPALEEMEKIVRDAILVPFAQDWRHRAVASVYLSKNRVVLETVASPVRQHPSARTTSAVLSPPATPLPPHNSPSTPVSPSPCGRDTSHQTLSPRAPSTSSASDLLSNLSSLSLEDLFGASMPTSSKKGKSAARCSPVSSTTRDFIDCLPGVLPTNSLTTVEYALEHIGRAQWEEYLRNELQVNSGLAKALALLMRYT